jgi:ribosomal protein S17E
MEVIMPEFADKFINNYLPTKEAPFFKDIKKMLCPEMEMQKFPLDNDNDPSDLAIHCPSVIWCIEDILIMKGRNIAKDIEKESGIVDKDKVHEAENVISDNMSLIKKVLGISSFEEPEGKKLFAILQIAALYHDIGKKIRSANHPRLGVNILRYSDKSAQLNMIKMLTMGDEEVSKSNENRFSLVCSIVDHHDKFGVVSTGEGSLAIFSDILYYRSEKNAIDGILKNITSVMLITLADIAAVCIADKNKELKRNTQETVYKILENPSADHSSEYTNLKKIWQSNDKNIFMGLTLDKVQNIIEDWKVLTEAAQKVEGSRTKLREYLVRMDQNPYRTIKRIIRLIRECCYTTKSNLLIKWVTETDIESTLISFFGSHQFLDFCTKFAYIVKMDYGLKFFKGIVCACVRDETNTKSDEKDSWQKLNEDEQKELEGLTTNTQQHIVENISTLFIKVISEIIRRYNSMLELKFQSAYRFGLQMRTLTDDKNVRNQILRYLCSKHEKNENVALTWIADEVTFWSMD